MDLTAKQRAYTESLMSYVVALVHAVWYHASIGQISQIPAFVSEKLKPIIKREEQVCITTRPRLSDFRGEETYFLILSSVYKDPSIHPESSRQTLGKKLSRSKHLIDFRRCCCYVNS